MPNFSLVRVIKSVSYTNDDGTVISAQANGIYKLIKKANDKWWYVESNDSRCFYLPRSCLEEFRAFSENDRQKDSGDTSYEGETRHAKNTSKEQWTAAAEYDIDSDQEIPRTYSGGQKKLPSRRRNEIVGPEKDESSPMVNRERHANDDMAIESRLRSKDFQKLRNLPDDSVRASSMRIPNKSSTSRSLSPTMEGRNLIPKNTDHQIDRQENKRFSAEYEHIADFRSLAEEAREESERRDKKDAVDIRNTKERRDSPIDEHIRNPSYKGWKVEIDSRNGKELFINPYNGEIWYASHDSQDRTYYYNSDRSQSKWDLPDIRSQGEQNITAPLSKEEPDEILEGGGNTEAHESDETYQTSLGSLVLSYSGIVTRKKLLEAGKVKVKKMSWTPLYIELRGFYLVFYKDVKLAKKVMSASLDRQESKCDLRGAGIVFDCTFSKKRNVMLIACQSGLVFMLQFDRKGDKSEWYQKLDEHIRKYSRGVRADPVEFIDGEGLTEVAEIYNESEQSFERLRTMLKRLLARRPPVEILKQKGILKEQIFGCPLDSLCEREQVYVPLFVQLCLSQIEKLGLDNEGLYRVGGNMALVNKIKYMVDQELKPDLDDDLWKDVPVLTSSIKLYFRDLPESLLSKSLFDDFITISKKGSEHAIIKLLTDYVNSCSVYTSQTMHYLMLHLTRIVNNVDKTKMNAANLSIVWGPNLMKTPVTANIAANTVYQNRIVEKLLTYQKEIFKRVAAKKLNKMR